MIVGQAFLQALVRCVRGEIKAEYKPNKLTFQQLEELVEPRLERLAQKLYDILADEPSPPEEE